MTNEWKDNKLQMFYFKVKQKIKHPVCLRVILDYTTTDWLECYTLVASWRLQCQSKGLRGWRTHVPYHPL